MGYHGGASELRSLPPTAQHICPESVAGEPVDRRRLEGYRFRATINPAPTSAIVGDLPRAAPAVRRCQGGRWCL
jgi:hypothetical protein